MVSAINYDATQFDRASLAPIRGEHPTSKPPTSSEMKKKANARSVYSNLEGGDSGPYRPSPHRRTNVHSSTELPPYAPNHPGPLTILADTTASITIVMRDTHTHTLTHKQNISVFSAKLMGSRASSYPNKSLLHWTRGIPRGYQGSDYELHKPRAGLRPSRTSQRHLWAARAPASFLEREDVAQEGLLPIPVTLLPSSMPPLKKFWNS